MIAPIEDGTASKAYAVGEQFIMNDLLCEATQAIAQGDTMVIGTNCEESEQLSKQVKDINNDLSDFKFRNNNGVPELSIDNGTTWQKIGGGDMPTLNYTTPLHSFTTGNLTYTATKECYLLGQLGHDASIIRINNNIIAKGIVNGQYAYISPLKLTAGDVVASAVVEEYLKVYDIVD